ncbi:hypothetical protein [Streptomyces sp. NPDC005573]|uniref:hypothetical protein n=1 Tax=Streptomyces sp. NPDC005573 TaxID=3156890 RepID=UPI0033B53605
MAVALAGADSPGEHLQLAAFTAMAAGVFIWLGRRQRRTGRGLAAPSETMRAGDRLIQPPPPSRGYRIAGGVWIGVGSIFVLPAVFNLVAAIGQLVD